jgi:Protein of unknown function (DUF3570)
MTSRSTSKSLRLRTGLLSWLVLMAPRLMRGDDSFSYKYEDYTEAGGRMAIKTQGALVSQDLGPDMRIQAEGVIDAIAGATPNGQPAPAGSNQVVLTEMHDRRKAWNATLSRQFPRIGVSLGYAHSLESDYLSDGISLNTVTDFNDKNTEMLVGVAGTDDRVKVFYQTPWARKRSHDAVLGVTQLLNPVTSITANLSWENDTGYLTDPYKLVQKDVEVAPGVFLPFTYAENRPDHRAKWIALLALNHAVPTLNGAVEASYRFFHDTYGTNAHTIAVAWIQKIGSAFYLEPELRGYEQSAADFYHYQLDTSSISPTGGAPVPQGPFYSSDYRLSALRTYSYGLKGVWNVTAAVRFDVKIEEYLMRGRDEITPQSAYPRARILNAGLTVSW